ncbi:hypothetical protein LSTR_LSTR007850 [Laodelphax striatellus]|uniref:Gustatory receptor n=1 Tax=Laodelphax striatellus TaxID=195883 RepID=A0A482WMV5_LAOST|nr:hypothetical protein LSTR_LSTR007850 [Laodelphax striatellus]
MTALSEIRLSSKKGSPSDDFSSRFSYFISPVFYSVIYLMRLYTELMWYMFCNALRNSAVQLADDYKNDLYRDRSLDRTHYEYLWTKLAKLQSRLTSTLSQIYGYQLAINFLHLLFHGFFFLELIYSNMTIETWVRVLQDPNEWSHFTDILFGLHGQTTICLVYLWLGSTTAGSAQKALVDSTKQKLLGILSDNALSDIELHEQASIQNNIVITLKACLVQRALYYWKARDIYDYINDWKTFEIEYKSSTGKQLNAVSFKKTLTISILSTLAIIYVAIMSLLGERHSNGPPLNVMLVFLTTVFYSVIYLMRLYTELMWYMFSNALRNAALQLAGDYKNDLCQERGLDRTNYEYLWTKLAKLQSRLPLTFSKIYGYQLAINFLQLLFHGFVFFEFIFRYMTIEILVRVLKDPEERFQFIYIMLGLYGQTTICFVYLWLGSVTAGAAQKALVDNTKKTLLGILSDKAESSIALHKQAREFLQKVTATNTQIIFSGYGRIDRNFFCTILITWINYMIILLQFKISFYEEDKDETIKGTSRNKRSISNVEFENYDSFFGFDNININMSAPLPFVLDWHPSSTIYT